MELSKKEIREINTFFKKDDYLNCSLSSTYHASSSDNRSYHLISTFCYSNKNCRFIKRCKPLLVINFNTEFIKYLLAKSFSGIIYEDYQKYFDLLFCIKCKKTEEEKFVVQDRSKWKIKIHSYMNDMGCLELRFLLKHKSLEIKFYFDYPNFDKLSETNYKYYL